MTTQTLPAPNSWVARTGNSNPFARLGTIYREHENTCPSRNQGRRYADCHCPIHIDYYKDGVRIQRSLLTRIWPEAEQKLKRVREGESLEAILSSRLFKHHGNACPYKDLGRRHTKCNCMIFADKFRTKDGRFIKQLSLRTRLWEEAEQKLQRLNDGESVEAIGAGALFRYHRKTCPNRNQGGKNFGRTAHTKCDCPIRMRIKRRNGGYGTRSLHTTKWEEAVRRLAEHEAPKSPSLAKRRKPGPDRDMKTAKRISEIITGVTNGGDSRRWRGKLDDICEALDSASPPVPCPQKWLARYSISTWCRAAMSHPNLAIKAIEARLANAQKCGTLG